jgi:hypothetical protein
VKTTLRAIFLTAAGRLSKTKVTVIVAALTNLLQVFGVLDLTTEQLEAVNTALIALAAIFLRDGIDNAP